MTTLTDARAIGEEFARIIEPYCDWIELAGSVRRGKSEVKDVEIVVIPDARLLPVLDEMVASGQIEKARYGEKGTFRWGDKYRGLIYQGVKIEVFAADEQNLGYVYWLRTGPGDANQFVMKQTWNLKAPFQFKDGYAITKAGGERLAIGAEYEMFMLLGLPKIDPAERTIQRYQSLLRPGHKWGNPADFIVHEEPAEPAKEGGFFDWSDEIDPHPYLLKQGEEYRRQQAADAAAREYHTTIRPEQLRPWRLPWLHPDGSGNVVIRSGETWVYCDPTDRRALKYWRWVSRLDDWSMFVEIEKHRCLEEFYGVPRLLHGRWMREHGAGMW